LKQEIKILGSYIAERIEAVGKNVKKFHNGDEVYGDLSVSWGGFAEYVYARENDLALKLKSMSFGESAAIALKPGKIDSVL
jgi:NADPH:quinone reductase-like Zn-dependent oxidoreductase